MTRIFLSILILLLVSLSSFASVEAENIALIDSIDVYAKKYHLIRAQKTELINSLKAMREQMTLSEHRIRLGEDLGRCYLSQNLDSTMIYWRQARHEAEELGNKALDRRLTMNILAALPLVGVSIEALEKFEKIKPEDIPQEARQIYWLDKSEIYFNIQKPYPDGEYKNYYRAKAAESLDSLRQYYHEDSPVAQFISAYIYLLKGDENLSVASFIKTLPKLENRPELYDFAIGNIVNFYRKRPEYKALYHNYLYRQALAQLKNGGVKSPTVAEAGEVLLEDGKYQLGQQLMLLAMQTGDKNLGPYSSFDYAWYTALISEQRTKIQTLTIIIAILLIMIMFIALIRLRHYRVRTRDLQQRLTDCENHHRATVNDMTKVSGSILSMAIFTDEQIKEYNLFVQRKLKAGQVKDLYRDVESGEYMHGLTEKFFIKFDESFFDSFPGFVDKLNELFIPGRELSLLPNGRMSPELRIAAFMRLGINDSTKLSQVLGLSINTIYTYRNRLKGRAKNRKDFDSDVQTIAFNA